jgi:hypothetical protein
MKLEPSEIGKDRGIGADNIITPVFDKRTSSSQSGRDKLSQQ